MKIDNRPENGEREQEDKENQEKMKNTIVRR